MNNDTEHDPHVPQQTNHNQDNISPTNQRTFNSSSDSDSEPENESTKEPIGESKVPPKVQPTFNAFEENSNRRNENSTIPAANQHQASNSPGEKPTWDAADERPQSSVNDGKSCWESATKVARIIYYIFLFILLMGTGLMSRVISHIMIWKLNPPHNSTSGLSKLTGILAFDANRTQREIKCHGTCSNRLPASWECRNLTGGRCTLLEDVPSVNIAWIWALFLVIIAPYIYVFLSNLARICTKKVPPFRVDVFVVVLTTEIIHTTGLCLLVFYVMPTFDPIAASILNLSVQIVPSILSIIFPVKKERVFKQTLQSRLTQNGHAGFSGNDSITSIDNSTTSVNKRDFKMFMTQSASILLSTAVVILFCLYIFSNQETSNIIPTMLSFLFGTFFVSVTWWENFVRVSSENLTLTDIEGKELSKFSKIFTIYQNTNREIETCLTSFVKIVLSFLIIISLFAGKGGGNGSLTVLQALLFPYAYNYPSVNISSLIDFVTLQSQSRIAFGCTTATPFIMAAISISCSFIFYKLSQHACRILCQRIVFGPVLFGVIFFTPWILLLLLNDMNSITTGDCNVLQPFWALSGSISLMKILPLIIAYGSGVIALFLLSIHIWQGSGLKIVKATRLFTKSIYCGIFCDLSVLLTKRRINIEAPKQMTDPSETATDGSATDRTGKTTYYPYIYFCATMWHETENEMNQLLKSIFRTDQDQYKRSLRKDPELYEFEAHVFFDDAFLPRKGRSKGNKVNEFVKMLENSISITARTIYNDYDIGQPQKYKTPYGARYVWELLGGGEDSSATRNKLIVHLKDKSRIRHKKRWSQVMYMYYFLGYKFQQYGSTYQTSAKDIADNTFILALDGDVDFKPEAILLLLDRMKKDRLVGASCGRIHPIGSGPMVWYQKFEYAVSHWLQKATEHVSGCVLCSPGCFSLFRGSALMDDNVMRTYTKVASNASDHIQCDQGEDRWLCTLLLKQGYKVDYSAASDALTFAPEGFYEFYNQRRRWAPSTMANILDLLIDWRHVTQKNQNISLLYIMYQMFLFVSSVLTPGTIFLLILGALMAAFPQIQPWLALVINIIPVGSLCMAIFLFKEETQLLLAAIFSVIYSLIMMVVFIGLVKDGIESQFCSVSVVFFCFVAGVFIIAAVIHPQEFLCLLHGFLYFLSVPSMSMLLMIYSLGNLHVVSWGTREVKTATEAGNSTVPGSSKNYTEKSCSFGTICKCIFCPMERNKVDVEIGQVKAETRTSVKNDNLESNKSQEKGRTNKPKLGAKGGNVDASTNAKTEKENNQTKNVEHTNERVDKGIFKECKNIDNDERKFWEELIEKYLKPLKHNASKQKETQEELLELRNKIFLGFFIINALFVTVVFVLTQVNTYQKTLQIPLPCTTKDETKGSIEPISIAFTLTFGLLLLIQFLGMLYHRFSTFSHILVSASASSDSPTVSTNMAASIESGTVVSTNINTRQMWQQIARRASTLETAGRALMSFTQNRATQREGLQSLRHTLRETLENQSRIGSQISVSVHDSPEPISIKRINYGVSSSSTREQEIPTISEENN